MDPIKNPFSPGAGTSPPELVGREGVLAQSQVLFGRIQRGKPEQSILLTGLRGVGKTVLLNEMKRGATQAGYRILSIETPEDVGLVSRLTVEVRSLLLEMDRSFARSEKIRRALAALKGFVSAVKVRYGGVELGLDLDAEKGVADSGNLEADLADLFESVGNAAQDCQSPILLLVDELQYCKEEEFRALIMALHRIQQDRLPFTLVGAGLPTLPGLAGKAKSYAERLFSYVPIGPLPSSDAAKAIGEPVRREGCAIEPRALARIIDVTEGYPYFLQEWGYQAWNRAAHSPITDADVDGATPLAKARLDQGFFRVRFDRLTRSERRFLRAMAGLGPGPQQLGEIAEALSMKATSLGPSRANLISKGMIYSPEYGRLAFTVPLFDEFMLRTMPP